VALLRERYPDERLQICHRIDRETSGVLLIARQPDAATFLKKAFARRAMKKSYLAIVHGNPADEGDHRPAAADPGQPHQAEDGRGRGRPALDTHYRVLERYPEHALLECEPRTGRQHQIRVHLAALGHPIVGDKLYRAGEKQFMDYCDGGMTPELLAAFDGLPRHALHAHRLTFPHPRTGAALTVESPLPADLRAFLDEHR
jgi:23S rRNA pseudouridine1911/1915/1917 synthase